MTAPVQSPANVLTQQTGDAADTAARDVVDLLITYVPQPRHADFYKALCAELETAADLPGFAAALRRRVFAAEYDEWRERRLHAGLAT